MYTTLHTNACTIIFIINNCHVLLNNVYILPVMSRFENKC